MRGKLITMTFLILQPTPPQYFAGLRKGAITWTQDPKHAQTFNTRLDAAETARVLRRQNGHKPDQPYIVVPADRAAMQDGD